MSKRAVLVTGANGHLGRRLIARLASGKASAPVDVRAAVRSERAARQISGSQAGAEGEIAISRVDYTNEKSLREAATGCSAVVHLVGILKETRTARYADAHEHTCEALAAAAKAARIDRVVYLSIFGSRADSRNACLASKGRAEATLLGGDVPACVLRVPMVLGPDDHASFSLRRQAQRDILPLLAGGRTLQHPIDAEDVVSAIVAALSADEPIDSVIDLGGPECLSHRDLVARARALYGGGPATVLPIPLGLVRAAVALLERVSPDPPMTRAMLDVLQHDDRVDPTRALARLGISLTPLDQTLGAYVGPRSNERAAA